MLSNGHFIRSSVELQCPGGMIFLWLLLVLGNGAKAASFEEIQAINIDSNSNNQQVLHFVSLDQDTETLDDEAVSQSPFKKRRLEVITEPEEASASTAPFIAPENVPKSALSFLYESMQTLANNDFKDEEECSSESLALLKQKAYSALFAVFNKAFPSRQYIKWTNFDVIGWPQEVMFYSSSSWSARDCESILKAVERDEISFVPKSNPSSKKSEIRGRLNQLEGKALLISRIIFNSSQIKWNAIKALCPNLHLTRSRLAECNEQDCKNLETALNSMIANYNLSIDLSAFDEIERSSTDKEDKDNVAALLRLQEEVHAMLLERYQATFPSSRIIHWYAVDVVGWPEDVIFYRWSAWSQADYESLVAAMPNIQFVGDSSSSGDKKAYISSAEMDALKRRTKEFFLKYFKKRRFDWHLIKERMSSFHLSISYISQWNWKDAKMMEEVFKYFEERYQDGIL